MLKVSLLILLAASLVATDDISSPSKDDSSPNLSLQLLVKELYNNEEEEKATIEGKIDPVGKNESEGHRFDVTKLQVPQPESNLELDKAVLPETSNIQGIKTFTRTNLKQLMQWLKTPKLDVGIPLGIRKPTVCNYKQYLNPAENKMILIQSNNFPGPYPPGFTCRWIITSPNNTKMRLTCDNFYVPKCAGCRGPEGFFVSRSGDPTFKDAKSYSGPSFSEVESVSNSLSIFFISQRRSKIPEGRFNCRVQLADDRNLPTAIVAPCSCGWTNSRFRIVNGSPAGVNEFPFMCGLVNADDATILCGCTLISNRYVLTAAHCLLSMSVSSTAVVLGEHDVNTGSDTSATILVRAAQFIPYPYYDQNTQRYDLGLVRLERAVTYNQNIGPVCLPFNTATWDLRGQTVTVMGWGTTEFGGQRSSVLMKTFVTIIDMSYCNDTYGSRVSWNTQYCTYREGTDACQYDSGGPLVWRNTYSSRYELVATVEYGWGCAMGYPSINNKVAPFLQWIIDNTPGETLCY